MASGFGINGGPGRCFEHFQDIHRCIQGAENATQECPKVAEDYMECLHGRKEFDRALAVRVVARQKKREMEGGEGGDGHH